MSLLGNDSQGSSLGIWGLILLISGAYNSSSFMIILGIIFIF